MLTVDYSLSEKLELTIQFFRACILKAAVCKLLVVCEVAIIRRRQSWFYLSRQKLSLVKTECFVEWWYFFRP